jgi:hypothetical protein
MTIPFWNTLIYIWNFKLQQIVRWHNTQVWTSLIWSSVLKSLSEFNAPHVLTMYYHKMHSNIIPPLFDLSRGYPSSTAFAPAVIFVTKVPTYFLASQESYFYELSWAAYTYCGPPMSGSGLLYCAVCISDCMALDDCLRVNTGKLSCPNHVSSRFLNWNLETMKNFRIADVPAEIGVEDLLNTRLQHCQYTSSLLCLHQICENKWVKGQLPMEFSSEFFGRWVLAMESIV